MNTSLCKSSNQGFSSSLSSNGRLTIYPHNDKIQEVCVSWTQVYARPIASLSISPIRTSECIGNDSDLLTFDGIPNICFTSLLEQTNNHETLTPKHSCPNIPSVVKEEKIFNKNNLERAKAYRSAVAANRSIQFIKPVGKVPKNPSNSGIQCNFSTSLGLWTYVDSSTRTVMYIMASKKYYEKYYSTTAIRQLYL